MRFENSPFSCQQVYECLLCLDKMKKFPCSFSYSPSVSVGRLDYREAYLAVLEEASCISDGLNETVSLYIQKGKWGRPKAKIAFWVKAFHQALNSYIYLALNERVQLGCLKLTKPHIEDLKLGKPTQEVLEWFLKERWGEYLLPLWAKKNAMEYINLYSYDWNDEREEDESDFQNLLKSIHDFFYLWTLNEKRLDYRKDKLAPPVYYNSSELFHLGNPQ